MEGPMSDWQKRYQRLLFDRPHPKVLRVTMNRPEKYNATDAIMHRELVNVWRDIDGDDTVNCVIIQGAGGKVFSAGGDFDIIEKNMKDYNGVAKAIAQFEKDVGPTDILVNNAGWDRFVNFIDTTPDLWDQIIAINLRGPLNMSHFVLKGMVARGRGRVVNIASDAGRVGSSQEAVYSACKGGIIAFTKTVAREVARRGITLNAVCPGPTDTPLLAAAAGEGERGERMR